MGKDLSKHVLVTCSCGDLRRQMHASVRTKQKSAKASKPGDKKKTTRKHVTTSEYNELKLQLETVVVENKHLKAELTLARKTIAALERAQAPKRRKTA